MGIFVLFGIFSPNKYVKYHIIIIIGLLIIYEIFDNKSIFSILVKKIGKYEKYYKLVDIKSSNYILLLTILMLISIYNLIIPNYSLFNLLKLYTKNH